MRTLDKYNEAMFFFKKFESATEKSLENRYYFSAFVSSLRSVFWVLQSDYNKNEGFNEWWEDSKKMYDKLHISYEVLNTIRTESIHEGIGYPMQCVRMFFEDYFIEYVEVLFDPAIEEKLEAALQIGFHFNKNIDVPFEYKELKELIGKTNEYFIKTQPEPIRSDIGYKLTPNGDFYNKEGILNMFNKYLKCTYKIILDANERYISKAENTFMAKSVREYLASEET